MSDLASSAPFENPEIAAMAAICEILQRLPDDAARLRVMYWAFGRFNPEFKRAMTAPPADASAAPAIVEGSLTGEIAAVAPGITSAPSTRNEDFASQISELRDLFGGDARVSARPLYTVNV
jgi:hypothetical protein